MIQILTETIFHVLIIYNIILIVRLEMRLVKGISVFFILFANMANAHGGMTNSDGCHMNHSIGQFHCHQKKRNFYETTYCLNVNFEKYCGYARSTCNSLQREYGGYCSVDW